MQNTVIVDAVRTPIGRFGGALARVRPDDMAAHVIQKLLERAPAAASGVQEVVFGATNQAGEDNRNVARMASLLAGLPYEVAGVTVNRLCGSGMEALAYAHRAVRVGDLDVAIAGGVESMSRAPFSMPKTEQAFSRQPPVIYDTTIGWRYPNPRMQERFSLDSMGETAENVAERYGISRQDQDAFALDSHKKAAAASEAGRFQDEMAPLTAPPASRKESPRTIDFDECIRADSTLEKLARLKPVFREGGSVTPGNSSPINDGAAALLVTSESFADKHGLEPLARVVATAVAGVEPNYMGIGPIPATRKALERAGMSIDQMDLIELNEAFAAQSLACVRELGMERARVNVNGGAIALGHPIGCSGARIVGTLLHEMRRREVRYGLATLCIGVGQGLATIVERIA